MPPFIAQPQLRFRQAPPADFSGLGDVVSNALRERALSKDFADAAAVDAQGGSAADVMARLAGGRSLEAREAGLTGLLRARAQEDQRAADAAAAAESARRFGVTTGLQRERLDIARQAASRTAVQPTFEEKERRKLEIKEEARVGKMRSGGRRVLGMVDRLDAKVGAPGSDAEGRFESATGPFEIRTILPGESKETLRRIRQDAQAINTALQRELLKGGGSITENERNQINQILGSIEDVNSAKEARALLDNFRGIVSNLFEMEEQPAAAAPTITLDAEGNVIQ